MSVCVLDASAVLAYVFDERGGDIVEGWLEKGAAISALTVQETMSKLVQKGFPADAAEEAILVLGLDMRPLDHVLAVTAGGMYPLTRAHGLSHGDRACLALGIHLDLPVITADTAWLEVATVLNVRVEQFR